MFGGQTSSGLFGNSQTGAKPGFSFGGNGSQPTLLGESSGKRQSLFGAGSMGSGATSGAPSSGFSFGARPSAPTAPSGFSLGGNTTTSAAPGLFGKPPSGGQPSGLFGNSYSTQQAQTPNRSFVSTIDGNGNPYGIDISATATSVKEMPKPLTPAHSRTETKQQPFATKRGSSVVSAGPSASQQPKTQSKSIFNGLKNTLFGKPQQEDVSGIFSQETKVTDGSLLDKANSNLKSALRSFKPKSSSLADVGSTRSDLRKLTVKRTKITKNYTEIDANEVIFKRRKTRESGLEGTAPFKAFNPSRVPTKSFTNVPREPKEAPDSSSDSELSTPTSSIQKHLDPLISSESDYGVYWSSPSISELSSFSLQELANVENFIVGRKGFGQVAFQYPVDLTAFSKDLKEVLGRVIKFEKGFLMVYDDTDSKPAVGNGLNVPAVVTVQGSYPKDPVTGKHTSKPSSELLRSYINKLKGLMGMEYVNYDPLLGAFTFKVEHFSIWGVIDEDDDDVDPDLVRRFKQQQQREVSVAPTSVWKMPEEDMSSDGEALDTPSASEEPLEDDGMVSVKAYEPDMEDIAMDALDTAPRFAVAFDWDEQLKLAGGIDSALNVASQREALSEMDPKTLNDILFGQQANEVSLRRKVKKERRIESAIQCAHFASDGTLVLPDGTTKTLGGLFSANDRAGCEDIASYMAKSTLFTQRPNGFSKAKMISLSFAELKKVSSASSQEKSLWGLLSCLFDETETDSTNAHILDIQRKESLIAWLKQRNAVEVERLLSNARSDPLDCLFLKVINGDLMGAASLAIKSNNPHLAVLVTMLNSHDTDVAAKAARQLNEWRKSSTLKYIPEKVVKIYQLLKGISATSEEFAKLTEGFSWTLSLNAFLLYGDASMTFQECLKVFTKSLMTGKTPISDPYFHVLRLLISSLKDTVSVSSFVSLLEGIHTSVSALDARVAWIIFELIVKTGRVKMDAWQQTYDMVTLQFAQQVASLGMVAESVFLLNFLENDDLCKFHLTNTVHRRIDSLGYFDSDAAFEDLVRKTHVPRAVLYEGKALKQIYLGDNWAAVDSLLNANLLNEAHRLVLAKVAPTAVIEDGNALSRLGRVLSRMHTLGPEIDGWKQGGEIYRDYVALLNTDREDSKDLLVKLVASLPLLRKLNFTVKAAITLMDRKIVALGLDTSFVDADRVASMPLPESEINYVKKRSPVKKLKASLMV